MNAPHIEPGSLWRKRSAEKVVRVLSADPKTLRVGYQVVPDGRTWSTWFDRFFKEFEPDHPIDVAEILRRLRASAAAGNPLVVMPYEARAIVRAAAPRRTRPNSDTESTAPHAHPTC